MQSAELSVFHLPVLNDSQVKLQPVTTSLTSSSSTSMCNRALLFWVQEWIKVSGYNMVD